MTFAVSSTNISGAIGGVNQALKPNLDTDKSFDRILDSRIEKSLDQSGRNKAHKQKQKPVYNVNVKETKLKRASGEITKSDELAESEVKSVSKSSDDRIAKLKKLAKKIKEDEGLDDKEIKELKDELDTLIESLLSAETELTSEQLTELSSFLGEISEVLSNVESKLEEVLVQIETTSENGEKKIVDSKKNVEKQMLETVDKLKENISKVEELITQTLNGSENATTKSDFNELLSEIMKDMEAVSENAQKILENNPELLKETVKTADNTTEVAREQITNELKVETDIKSATVVQNEDANPTTDLKEESKDTSSKLVEVDKTQIKTDTKAEEMIADKNVEILKFENTLIRSAKVNNPAKAQAFEKNIMKQVINHTTSNLNVLENGSEMILKLYPKNLGEVAVKLAIDKGVVLAEFNVESQAVKEVLESNLNDLRTALSDKGFNLDGLDVSVGDNGSQNNSSQHQQSSKGKNKFFDILDVEEEILNANTSENSTTIDILK